MLESRECEWSRAGGRRHTTDRATPSNQSSERERDCNLDRELASTLVLFDRGLASDHLRHRESYVLADCLFDASFQHMATDRNDLRAHVQIAQYCSSCIASRVRVAPISRPRCWRFSCKCSRRVAARMRSSSVWYSHRTSRTCAVASYSRSDQREASLLVPYRTCMTSLSLLLYRSFVR